MSDLTVGTAFLAISPSFRGFADQVDAEAEGAGESAGAAFGSAFSSEAERSTSGANVGPSDADSASKGESSGTAFADAFKARVTAALESLPDAKIGADATEADAAIDEIRARLEALRGAQIGIDISDTEALAAIDEVKADLDELASKSPSIDVSTNGVDSSIAELEALKAEADEINGKTVKINTDSSSEREAESDTRDLGVTLDNVVEKALASGAAFTDSAGKLHSANGEYASAASLLRDVEAAGGDADAAFQAMSDAAGGASGGLSGLGSSGSEALGGISPLIPAIGALVAAAVPLAGLAAGGLASLPALLSGAGAGIGALYLGFSGITGAISDYTSQQNKAGSATASTANTAVSSAETQRNAANSVQSAQEALTNATVNGARQIQQAQEALANAETQSDQNIASAAENLANVQESAANSVHSAQEQLVSSEQSLTEAEYSEQQAQESLTNARQAATDALVNYNDQLSDGVLNAQQDQINLQEAQAALAAGPAAGSASTAQEQLVLNVQKAQQAIQDQGDQYAQLQQQAGAANAAGVDGSQQVLNAQHQLDLATQGVATAQQSVADSATGLAQAQEQAIQKVADAQNSYTQAQISGAQSVSDAQRALAVAQQSDAQSTADAQRALTNALADQSDALQKIANGSGATGTAVNQFAADMAHLSPVAQQFVDYVTGTLLPELDLFKAAIQEAIVPGVLAGLQDLQPLFAALAPLFIEAAQWIGQFVQQIGQFLGSATGTKEVFDIFQAGLGFFKEIQQPVLNLFEALTGGASKTGPLLQTMGQYAGDLINAFAKWVNDGGFQGFLNWLQKNGPSILSNFKDILTVAGQLVVALVPVGEILDKAIVFVVQQFAVAVQTVEYAVQGVTAVVKDMIPWFTESLPHAISVTSGAFTTGFQAVHDIVNTIWHALDNDVLHPLEDVFTTDIPNALSTMSGFFTSIWNAIDTAVTTAVNAVWTAINTALGLISAAWSFVWTAISTFAQTVWSTIWGYVNTGINAVSTTIGTVLGSISTAWSFVWGVISSFAQTVWDTIFGFVSSGINAVWNTFDTVLGWISAAWSFVWGAISGGISAIWDTIGGFVTKGINDVWTTIETVLGTISTAWTFVWDVLSGAFSTVWDNIQKAAVDGVNGVIDIINGITGAINIVLNFLHIPSIPAIPHVDQPTILQDAAASVASALNGGSSGAFHSGGMVGSGGTPMSGPLTSDERMIRVQVGEEVLTANDPRHANNLGGGFLNHSGTFHGGGIVGWLGSVWDDATGLISGITGDALGALGGAIGITASPAIDAAEGAVGAAMAPFGPFGGMLAALVKYLGDGAKSFLGNVGGAVTSKQGSTGSGGGGVVVPNGPATGDMLTMFQDILQGIGAPIDAQTIQDLTAWQQQEGGWTNDPDMFNPFNTTQPAGGSHGTNSVGVQSYPTFSAGLAATVATLTNGLYPGILSALRSSASLGSFEGAVDSSPWGTVFHEGGIVGARLYDNGGILEPGVTLAVNNTGHDEIVAPNLSALRSSSSNSTDRSTTFGDIYISTASTDPQATKVAVFEGIVDALSGSKN